MALGVTAFPGAIDSAETLAAAANNLSVALTSAITDSDTLIPVADVLFFPAAGFATIVDSLTSPTKIEIIAYVGSTGSNLSVVARGAQGTTPQSFSTGFVEMRPTAGHHNVLVDAILAIENKIGTGSTIALSQLATVTASRALVSNASGVISASSVTATELGYLSGVTSAIQTQFSNKADLNHNQSATTITTGELALARGGTGSSLADPNADRLLFWDDSAGAVTWLTIGSNLTITGTTLDATGGGGGGSGTVTSVGLSLPNIFTVSNSPVTTTGTLTATLATQASNLIFAGPTTGSAAAPTFRSLVAGDIPALSYEAPLTFSTGLTRVANTVTVNTTQNISTLSNLTANGFVKTSGGTGALSIDTATYLTANQTITLSGDVTGSGATGITATIANSAVTLAKLADLATQTLIGRNSGTTGAPEAVTASQVIDWVGSTRGAILYRGASGWAILAPGTNGTYLQTQGAGADPVWAAVAGGSGGTVTSVGLSLPAIFTVSGSPVTSSGTLTATLATQTANTLFAGPTTGSAAAPAFRAMVAADIPNGIVSYLKLQDISVTGRVLGRKDTGAGSAQELTVSDVLDFVGSTAQGDILYRGASSWTRLAAGTSGQFLQTQGAGANPQWASPSGSGTVTSVALSMPGMFTVSGSPITSSGTFTVSLATQNANLVLVGPINAPAAAPTFRLLEDEDIPSVLTISKNRHLTTNGFVITSNGDGTLGVDTASYQPLDSDLTSIAALTPANDDIIQRKAGAWTNRTMSQLKTDLALSKSDVGLSNVENTALSTWAGSTSITTLGTIAAGTWQGAVIGSAYGGAGTVNGILKANGTGTVSAASAGTDYEVPLTFSTGLTRTTNTITIGNSAITNAMLAGSIQASKLVGTDIATVGTITSGTLSTGAVLGGVTVTLGSDATGDIYYRNSGGVLTRLGIGTTGQVLTVASGLPSWATGGGGGGGTPGGSSGQVQYNDSSAFNGSALFTFSPTVSPNVVITANVGGSTALRVVAASSPTASIFQVTGNVTTTVHFAVTSSGAPTAPGATNSERFGAGSVVSSGSTGQGNTAIGANAACSTTNDDNTMVGAGSGSSGNNNSCTGVGRFAAAGISGNTGITAVGATAGRFCRGEGGTFIGFAAGQGFNSGNPVTGGSNTAIGNRAGYSLTSGTNNVYLGHRSGDPANGSFLVTGSNNTALGYFTNTSTGCVTLSSTIAIGANASATASNQCVIGGANADGQINDMYIGSGVTFATPVNVTINASGGSGTNIAGADLSLAGGRGTGSAAGGVVNIRTAPTGSSGTALNALVTALRVDASTTATHTRLLVFDVDTGLLSRVTVGAADSGGTGFKVLRIPN